MNKIMKTLMTIKDKYNPDNDLLFTRYDGKEIVIKNKHLIGQKRIEWLLSQMDKEDQDHYNKQTNIPIYNVLVPKEYLFGYGGRGFPLMPIDVLLAEKNKEIQTALLREYTFERFIKVGGGECVLNPKDGDYPHASLWKVQFNNLTLQFIKLINRTIEDGSDKLTIKDRVNGGLTEEGHKIYVVCIPNVEWPNVFYAREWVQGRMDEKFKSIRPSEESIITASNNTINDDQAKLLADLVYDSNCKIKKIFDANFKAKTQYNLEIES